jgi:pyrroline-5-carboxylate reductase
MKIAFLGCGSMGEAIMTGLLSSRRDQLTVVATTRTEARASRLRASHGIVAISTAQNPFANIEAAQDASIVVLGTKPYGIASLARVIAGSLNPNTVVITVAAATSLDYVQQELPPSQPLVRAMPNTPLRAGRGVVGLTPGKYATAQHVRQASEIFKASGVVIEIPEGLQDAVSAISGSGPAYVFYLAEAMASAARKLGIDPETASVLARNTVIGAGTLLEQSQSSPEDLRRAVSSPNGTTERAIATFETYNFAEIISKGATAATVRAAEMAQEIRAETGAQPHP